MKAFIEYQFANCLLIWMFCSRSSNNRINHLLERAQRIIYNDHSSTFEDLLVKYNLFSVHLRSIRLLAADLCKAKNNVSSQLMLELFERREANYNIPSQRDFSLRSINRSYYDLKSLRYLEPKIWNLLPQDMRSANCLFQFIRKINNLQLSHINQVVLG